MKPSHDMVTNLEFQGFSLIFGVAFLIDFGSLTSLPDSYSLLGSFSYAIRTDEGAVWKLDL